MKASKSRSINEVAQGATGGLRSDLPSGELTFLFTDIEGSTRLLQRLGDEYTELLEGHASILRRAISEHAGVEVSTDGDAFFAVFPEAVDALTAAASAQRAFAAQPWPGDTEVRVRMGIHSGNGKRGGDNYVGLDVHRAARIAASAHGGQVVLSEETRVLAGPGLTEGLSISDLGAHRLKDLERPERLYQLTIAGLVADFPALRSLEARPSNLPKPLTDMVGRDEELAAVVELLDAHRLVTLIGPGGTGKTRLSIAAATLMLDRVHDGVVFVALDAIRDEALVPSVIAQALAVRETAQEPPLEAAKRFLRDLDLLLVLDNFEHLTDAVLVVDELMSAAPRLRVLATSRVPLRLYGEQRYPVPPLSLPDAEHRSDPDELMDVEAVRLFVDRARAVQPGFAITTSNAAAIAGICVRLDGLPLAIELAAARVATFPPEEILKLLDRSLAVLSADIRNLPRRQQSLRGAIAWSLELLDDSQQRLFRRLAVFFGGFTLSDAEIVAGPGDAPPDGYMVGISALVDASLLRQVEDRSGVPRFGMLETIHEYAVEALAASGEADAVARRHAHHFMSLAEEAGPHLNRPDQAAWFDRLNESNDNLRAALRWATGAGEAEVGLRTATAIWRFWQRRGHLREGRETFGRLLGSRGIAPAQLARAVSAAGSLAYWQADLSEADRLYRQALDLDRGADDRASIADDLYNLGFVAMASRDFRAAGDFFSQSAEAFRAVGDRARLAEVSGPLGVVQLQAGNVDDAQRWIEQARDINRDIGDRARLADNTMVLGIIQRRRNNPSAASAYGREAVSLIREIGDQARLPLAIESVAAVALVEGHDRRAITLAGAARHMRETLGGVVPTFWDSIDEGLEAARLRVGDDEYAAAWAEGEKMTLDRAVELALETPPAPGSRVVTSARTEPVPPASSPASDR